MNRAATRTPQYGEPAQLAFAQSDRATRQEAASRRTSSTRAKSAVEGTNLDGVLVFGAGRLPSLLALVLPVALLLLVVIIPAVRGAPF